MIKQLKKKAIKKLSELTINEFVGELVKYAHHKEAHKEEGNPELTFYDVNVKVNDFIKNHKKI